MWLRNPPGSCRAFIIPAPRAISSICAGGVPHNRADQSATALHEPCHTLLLGVCHATFSIWSRCTYLLYTSLLHTLFSIPLFPTHGVWQLSAGATWQIHAPTCDSLHTTAGYRRLHTFRWSNTRRMPGQLHCFFREPCCTGSRESCHTPRVGKRGIEDSV